MTPITIELYYKDGEWFHAINLADDVMLCRDKLVEFADVGDAITLWLRFSDKPSPAAFRIHRAHGRRTDAAWDHVYTVDGERVDGAGDMLRWLAKYIRLRTFYVTVLIPADTTGCEG